MESASGGALFQTVCAAFTAGNIKLKRLNIKLVLPLCGSWPDGDAFAHSPLSSVEYLKFDVRRPDLSPPAQAESGSRPVRGEMGLGATLALCAHIVLCKGGRPSNLTTSLKELEIYSNNRERYYPQGAS